MDAPVSDPAMVMDMFAAESPNEISPGEPEEEADPWSPSLSSGYCSVDATVSDVAPLSDACAFVI